MIWTREEMHHSTGDVPSCPAHPAFPAGAGKVSRGAHIREGEQIKTCLGAGICLPSQKTTQLTTICFGSGRHLLAWRE